MPPPDHHKRAKLSLLHLPLIAAALFAIGHMPQASANWAYTTWGMTPEQVAAASGGAVRVLSPDKRTRNEDDHWEVAAEGTYADPALPPLSVGFMFDIQKGNLVCVLYNVSGHDAETLPAKLGERYGKPAKQSDFFTAKSTIWHTPDNIELVVNAKPLAAAVTHCQAEN